MSKQQQIKSSQKVTNEHLKNETDSNFLVPPINPNLHLGFSLADVIVQPDIGVVIRDNERYHLPPKAMEILVFLASMHGRTVSREQILEFGWGDARRSSSTLTHIISEIRHVLDDHIECPRFIQTIPRKGYRLLAKVETKSTAGFFNFSDPGYHADTATNTAWNFSISLIKSSRLFKASAAYVVFSWVILQVVALVLPIFNAPDWTVKFSTLVLIIGYPVVLGFQWLQQLKIKRKMLRNKDQKIPFLYRQLAVDSFFVILVLCVIYYLSTHLITFIEKENTTNPIPKVSLPQITLVENAVAILSFNKSANQEIPEYVVSGIQEELISSLTKIPEFQVASLRATNSINMNASIEELKNSLGVKYIIEGKVYIEQQSLIISTVIIDSVTGFQVWTNQSKGTLEQVLPIYQELSRKVISALNFNVLGNTLAEDTTRPMPTDSFEAYDFYLQGKAEGRKTESTSSLLKAEAYFLKSINIDPKFMPAKAGLCRTYMELYQLTDDPIQYQKGLEVCELTASNKTVSVESYLSLGLLYSIRGSYDDAKKTLEQAMQIDPLNPEILNGLANVEMKLKNNQKAEQLFLKSISLEPAYWKNYYQYGVFLYSTGQYEKAIPQFNKVNLLNNRIALAYNALGAVYFLNMDLENASKAWSNALKIEPSALTYSNLGTSLFFQSQFDKAVENYKKSVDIAPNDNTVWGNFADSLKYSSNSKAKAQSAYQTALKLAKQKETINPNDVDLKAQIARYFSELGQCSDALAYQNKIMINTITDPYVYYDLSISAINCQQEEQAQQMLTKIIEFNYPKDLLLADPQFLAYKEQLTQLFKSK